MQPPHSSILQCFELFLTFWDNKLMLIVDGGNEENVLLNVEFSGKKIVEM